MKLLVKHLGGNGMYVDVNIAFKIVIIFSVIIKEFCHNL